MSFTRLRYHVVTATRGRLPLITLELEGGIYSAFKRRALDTGIRIIALGGIEDHVHLLLACPPKLPLSQVVGVLKSGAAWAANHHPNAKNHFAWQRGYAAFTVNAWDYARVAHYVLNQKYHHHSNTQISLLEPELRTQQ